MTTETEQQVVRFILEARPDDHPDRFGPVTREELEAFFREVAIEVKRRKLAEAGDG